jgi:hypothetical protein
MAAKKQNKRATNLFVHHAAEAREHAGVIANQLSAMSMHLDAQKLNPTWSHTGDMTEIRNQLAAIEKELADMLRTGDSSFVRRVRANLGS